MKTIFASILALNLVVGLASWAAAEEPQPPLAKAPFDGRQAKAHQEAWAKHLGTTVETTNSVGMKMKLIPPGEFLMGSTDEHVKAALKVAEENAEEIKAPGIEVAKDRIHKNERPQHRVVISKPYWMGTTEVTVGQFKKFSSATGYLTEAEKAKAKATYLTFQVVSDDSPAAVIAWNDAVAYCNWLSKQEKATYRLPTEAEWEYACRAGTTTQYSFGDDVSLLEKYAWYRKTGGKTNPVGMKLPNAFNLFDMHGNVYEFCQDWFDEKWYDKSSPDDPTGPKTGSSRVFRGGSWSYGASACRSAFRGGIQPSVAHLNNGFRCVREALQAQPAPKAAEGRLTIELVAGGGTAVEGKPATECRLSRPFGVAFDAHGNMFICEQSHRLLRVDAKTGILTVVTSAKKSDASLGDGGLAADASFSAPHNLVADGQGNLFIADTGHHRVRRVDAKTGVVTTVAGTGAKEISGDDGPSTKAGLDWTACLCFNRDFTKLYLGGAGKSIRVVDMKTGTISTVTGIGGSRAQAVDSKGNLFTATGRGLRRLDTDGKVTLLEDPTAKPPLSGVKHLWTDRDDNIVIADEGNHLIRKFIVGEKKLVTLAGTGERGTTGISGPALQAQLAGPHGAVTHPRTGDVYIADSLNDRVLRIEVPVKDQRIFSTGHSFHAAFPPILDDIAKSGGFKDNKIVGVSSIGGSKAAAHVGRKEVTAALTDGTVDVLMTTPIYLPDTGIEQFATLGANNSPNFRLTMMEFWLPFDNYEPRNYTNGPKGSPTERVNPPAKVDHNAATGEGLRKFHKQYFDEMDEHAIAVNKKLGKQVVFVVPAGQAVIALREKIIAGKAPGLKTQEDLFTDTLGHQKSPITVMMGYCHYAVIYRRSPVGLPVPKALKVPGADAKTVEALNTLLQELAWEAVTQHPLSGVKADPSPAK